jgi:hypothetical protein
MTRRLRGQARIPIRADTLSPGDDAALPASARRR